MYYYKRVRDASVTARTMPSTNDGMLMILGSSFVVLSICSFFLLEVAIDEEYRELLLVLLCIELVSD